MSLHGISHDAWDRYTEQGSWYYEVLRPGYKYNMTDIAAALGIEQLKRCDDFYEARLRIAERYDEAFADLAEIETPAASSGLQHAWHLYVIQLTLDRLRIDRRDFIKALNSRRVGTSVHFIPLHLHPFYKQTYGYQSSDFPQASTAFERIVSLPIYPMMTEQNVSDVIGAVRELVQESRR